MSITEAERIIHKLSCVSRWSVYLLKYKHHKQKESEYTCCPVVFKESQDTAQYVKAYIDDIIDSYSDSRISKYSKVIDYDGTCDSSVIYKLSISDEMIFKNFRLLTSSLNKPDEDVDAIDFSPNACIIQGINDSENMRVMLISIKRPFKTYKHRFFWDKGLYVPTAEKTLILPTILDVIIYGDDMYLMNLQIENLFDMERASKKVAQERVYQLCECGFLSDNGAFESFALSGHNTRRFLSYKSENFAYINIVENRAKLLEQLTIETTEDGLIRTDDEKNVEKLVKFLCGKAAIDIVNGCPIEVNVSSPWN